MPENRQRLSAVIIKIMGRFNMGILGKLFGSSDVIDAGISAIDAAVYTEEEKAKMEVVKSKVKIDLLKAYEPFKIAQRLLALVFGIPYAIAWIATFTASFFIDVESQLKILSGTMGEIVLAIIAFYFLGGTLSFLSKAKK